MFMRLIVTCLAVVGSAVPLWAAPRPVSTRPAAAPLATVEADRYANALLGIPQGLLRQVALSYVRPVSHADLVFAALTGLYESASVPVPGSLRRDVDRAALSGDLALNAFVRDRRQSLGAVEAIQFPQDVAVSLRGLSRVLDPYSVVMSREEQRRGFRQINLFGVGIELVETLPGSDLVIKTVLPGSPAQRAGMLPGDRIARINGAAAETLKPTEVQQQLAGLPPAGAPEVGQGDHTALKPLELVVRSVSAKADRTITLQLQDFRFETVTGVRRNDDTSWDYTVDRAHRIAHVRLGFLAQGGRTVGEDDGTALDLRNTLDELVRDGLNGLILDLRWCPGGMLNEAVSIADLFLVDGMIAQVQGRADTQRVHTATGQGRFVGFPIVVLINGETTGGGELVAAALQDHKRAVVMGQRSMGKGSIQHLLAVPELPNAYLRLTQGTLQRPNGKTLNRSPDSKDADDWGVRPDPGHELILSPTLTQRLKDWWILQSLRPARIDAALPLDDPEIDPQQAAALRFLREQHATRALLPWILLPNVLPHTDMRTNLFWIVGATAAARPGPNPR